jgi:hypothetical protein
MEITSVIYSQSLTLHYITDAVGRRGHSISRRLRRHAASWDFTGSRELIEYTFQFLIETVLHIINFILCWGMNIQYNDMKPLSIMCDILSLQFTTMIMCCKNILKFKIATFFFIGLVL